MRTAPKTATHRTRPPATDPTTIASEDGRRRHAWIRGGAWEEVPAADVLRSVAASLFHNAEASAVHVITTHGLIETSASLLEHAGVAIRRSREAASETALAARLLATRDDA